MSLPSAHATALASSPIRTDADAAAFLVAIDSPLAGSFDRVGSRGAYRLVSAACERCGGSGIYSSYHGECFACGGAYTKDDTRRVYLLTEARGLKARLRREAREMQERDASEAAALAADPELAEALSGDHHILQDLAAKLRRWGSLTDAQRALALKIHAQQQQQQAEAAALTDAPEGRHAIEGGVLTARWDAGFTGDQVAKMLLAVDGDLGRFKVWTTVPATLVDAVESLGDLRGQRVALTVALTPKERGFAIGKRPSRAAIVPADDAPNDQ
jgi:predicted transcriptional regulator